MRWSPTSARPHHHFPQEVPWDCLPRDLPGPSSVELGCSLWVLACGDCMGTLPICSVSESHSGPQAPGDREHVWFVYPCQLSGLSCLGNSNGQTLCLMTPVSLRGTGKGPLAQASDRSWLRKAHPRSRGDRAPLLKGYFLSP